MRTANYLLGSGLACLTLGCGLGGFVIIGLLGILLVGVGLGLVLAGGAVARPATVRPGRAAAGMALIVVGVVALLGVSEHVCELAYRDAWARRSGQEPVAASQLAVLGLIPIPGVVLAAGLRLRTRWPWGRCVAWGVAAALAVIAAVGVFHALAAAGLPTDA